MDSRKNFVFLVLAGFFVTNAILAEVIGGKLINLNLGPLGIYTMSVGILPWPVVFLTTDLINEFYGKEGVKRLSLITAGLILYAFGILLFAMNVNAVDFSPVQDKEFSVVFGQSQWIIIGSIIAFIISQLTDVFIFWLLRTKTGGKMIWLRATGSTAVSQLIDTFIVLGIAFYLPGKINFSEFISLALTGYTAKLVIAVCLTPLIYVGHAVIGSYLKKPELPHNLPDTQSGR